MKGPFVADNSRQRPAIAKNTIRERSAAKRAKGHRGAKSFSSGAVIQNVEQKGQ